MIILFSVIVGISSIILSKIILKQWFNHLSFYTLIWADMIIWYELKLISYNDIRAETWIIVCSALILLWLGTLTIILAKDIFPTKPYDISEREELYSTIHNNEKLITKIITTFTFIGLINVYTHWSELIHKFGSIPNALIQANIIYQLRVEGELYTGIPYLMGFVHAAMVLGGMYSAYKGKFSLILLFPFIVLVVKSLAEVARAGMLLGVLEFSISFLLFNQYLKSIRVKNLKIKKKNIIIGFLIVSSLFISTIALVKFFRATADTYQASSRSLREWKGGVIFSPTIYMYISSDIGILDAYLRDENEKNSFGQQTFFPFYRFFSKFKMVNEPSYYQKGYYIPIWSNTGTYLRDLHADFGNFGVFVFPYLLGLLITFLIHRVFNGNIMAFAVNVYLYLIIALTFLNIATRLGNWLIGLALSILILQLLKSASKRKLYSKTINLLTDNL